MNRLSRDGTKWKMYPSTITIRMVVSLSARIILLCEVIMMPMRNCNPNLFKFPDSEGFVYFRF